MQYTDKDLLTLLSEVETQFNVELTKVELAKSENIESLAKAEDGEKAKKPEKKESKEAPPAEGEKKPEGKEAPPAEGKEAAPAEGEKAPAPAAEGEAAPAAPAAAAPAAPAAGSDQCDYDEEDMQHLQKMYMSMSRGELICHHDAIKMALDASAAPAADAAAAPAAPAEAGVDKMGMAMSEKMGKCGDMSMSKTETNTSTEIKVEVKAESEKELALAKSEAAAEKAKATELQKNLDAATVFITKLVEKVGAPQGKAITSLDVIAKSEGAKAEEQTLSKSEITAVLAKKCADPSLKKSDRDAINAFYLNGAGINTISHLLK